MQEITVFITTSPIPTNPNTDVINRTIASVRHFLPDSPIIIAADGVRDQQYYLKDKYDEYIQNLKKNINSGLYGDVRLIEAGEHVHQTGLLRLTLPHVTTKYIFWVEHDTPLFTHRKIDFKNILSALDESDFVMFFHLPRIPDEWSHMMFGDVDIDGIKYLKTSHWSSRTNLATKEYYEKCLSYYSPEARAMFESRLYEIVSNAHDQLSPLRHEHRLLIYAPEENVQYGGHYNGRGKEPTFNELQVF